VSAAAPVGDPPLAEPPVVEHAAALVDLPATVTEDFAELFRSQYPRLVRALELAGASHWQAEDVAQESFARTLRRWRQVRAGVNPPGYVFRTAFRLLRRRGLLPTTPLDDRIESPATPADEQASMRVDVGRALAGMPPRRRACVVMTWLAGMTTAETGEALGIAAGTVRKQLELARRQLSGDLAL
jgi:RNA polymerase sigma factor (sigma-70 family)